MRAVLFDLGNTLVGYYRAKDFAPILIDPHGGTAHTSCPVIQSLEELLPRLDSNAVD